MVRDGVRVLSTVDDIEPARWDALLSPRSTPFLRHAWLSALEKSGCASQRSGWTPRHLALFRRGELIAAAPAYLRDDSDGDFARDWDLASSAARARLRYYPKLSLTIPFTPCTGERVLVAPGEDRASCVARVLEAVGKLCADESWPAWQVLFPDETSAREAEAAGLALRVSFQFHWRNEAIDRWTTSSLVSTPNAGTCSAARWRPRRNRGSRFERCAIRNRPGRRRRTPSTAAPSTS